MKKLIYLLFLFGNVQAQQADVVLTIGHTDQINCLDFNPEGNLLASGGNDNLVKIWDLASGKELRTLTGNDGRLVKVSFAPFVINDKQVVAGLNYNDQLNVWDVKSGVNISSFAAQATCESFDFCLDGKFIVFYDPESNLVIADPLTGESTKKIPVPGLIRFAVHASGKRLVYLDYQGKMISIDLQTGNELTSHQLFPEFQFPVTKLVINPVGNLLAVAFTDNSVYTFNLETGKPYHIFKGHGNRVKDLCFDKIGEQLLSIDHDKQLIKWSIIQKKKVLQRETNIFGAQCIAMHPKEAFYAYAEYKTIRYCTLSDGEEQKSISSRGNSIHSMDYAQNDKYLATSASDISVKIWDLSRLKIDHTVQGFFPVKFTPDGNSLVCMGTGSTLFVYDAATGEKKRELPTDGELIQNLSFSSDGNYMAGAGFLGVIRIWNMQNGKIEKRFEGHAGGIYGTVFSPDGKLIASAGLDQTVRVWDVKSGKEIKTLSGQQVLVSDVDFSPDGKRLAACGWDKKIYVWNTETWELERVIEGHVNSIHALDFNATGKYLVSCAGNNTVSEADNSIRVWESASGKLICKFDNPTGQINQVLFDDKNDLIYSSGNDGYVKIWDLESCSEIASLASVGATDHFITSPDFYYTASKEALRAVAFRREDQLFPFEQFDIQLNRPDIIAQRIGKTPPNLLNAYKFVYKKRLKKLNFSESKVDQDFHLPSIEILEKTHQLFTNDSILTLNLKANDTKYIVNRIMLYVNGTPVYGRNGLDVSKQQKNAIFQEVKIPLMDGNNQIQVSCINEKGIESLIETWGVIKQGATRLPDLYLVSIGISHYQQTQFNLKYAAKDALEIAQKLTQAKNVYGRIHQLVLTDEQVKLGILEEIKTFLQAAGINDAVVLFFAGHGVLDENYDYYFATHDFDFEHPAQKGISYQQIEQILEGVKSYRKLLLMDTCHSGELDKEEIEKQQQKVFEKEVKFRAIASDIGSKDPFGVGNMQDLMNVLFTDSRKASGATVISSSGGAEYAMESDTYKNGLFTYCLLNCFSDWQSDLNQDRGISVSEWGKYALDKVVILSSGMQKPTSRAVNLEVDFRVW